MGQQEIEEEGKVEEEEGMPQDSEESYTEDGAYEAGE